MKQIAKKSKRPKIMTEFPAVLVSSSKSNEDLHKLDNSFLAYLGTINTVSALGRHYAMGHQLELAKQISEYNDRYTLIEKDIRVFNNQWSSKEIPPNLPSFEYFPCTNVLAYLAFIDMKASNTIHVIETWEDQLESMKLAIHEINQIVTAIGLRTGLIPNPLVRSSLLFQSHSYH